MEVRVYSGIVQEQIGQRSRRVGDAVDTTCRCIGDEARKVACSLYRTCSPRDHDLKTQTDPGTVRTPSLPAQKLPLQLNQRPAIAHLATTEHTLRICAAGAPSGSIAKTRSTAFADRPRIEHHNWKVYEHAEPCRAINIWCCTAPQPI